eukprot:5588090-Amphidinium_carterae.4
MIQLWDVVAGTSAWQATVGDAPSFARCQVLPANGEDPLDAAPSSCLFCSSCEEGVALFDCRDASAKPTLRLPDPRTSADATGITKSSPSSCGMCMSLCKVGAMGPHHLTAVYESTEAYLWDIRQPQAPLSGTAVGAAASPALCAATLWRTVWVACADGGICSAKIRKDGTLQALPQVVEAQVGASQEGKIGYNMLTARPDLRLVVAAQWDKRIGLFDAKTAKRLGALQCHDGGVLCACFDRIRGTFATGGEDGRIALWGTLADSYSRVSLYTDPQSCAESGDGTQRDMHKVAGAAKPSVGIGFGESKCVRAL